MLIHEDTDQPLDEFLLMPEESLSQEFGQKKVINVSFNDFNQSMSNEYDDPSQIQ